MPVLGDGGCLSRRHYPIEQAPASQSGVFGLLLAINVKLTLAAPALVLLPRIGRAETGFSG